LRHTGATLRTYHQNIQQQQREISQITKKKKQIDSMSDSGANKDKLMKQLSGLIKSTGVAEEDVQGILELVQKKKKLSSSSCMKSSKAPSPPSAMQELKLLSKMDVESQPQVDSEEEGSDKKNETEQVEHVIKKARPEEHTATLDSLPPSTVKKEPIPPKSDVEPQSEIDSEEEEASDKEKETDLPVDEERRPIEPPSDVVKSTKQKREWSKKNLPRQCQVMTRKEMSNTKNIT
jgi:hypothetical protein